MSVVFSHETALTLYRAGMVDPHSRKRSLRTCCSSLHALDEPFMRNALKIDDAPLHCLVDSPKSDVGDRDSSATPILSANPSWNR